jgi:hypothetical protein
MKTDDYKQELSISATLCRTNTKKYFLRSKNPQITRRSFVIFPRAAAGDHKNIALPNCA